MSAAADFYSGSAQQSTQPSALTFPAPLFRHISSALYLHRHLLNNPSVRPSGRRPSQHRDFTLTTDSLSHGHGSAVVRTGDTAVVCGIRGEILTLAPGDKTSVFESYQNSSESTTHAVGGHGIGGAAWGSLLVPNVELSTGCSKKYPLGAPGDIAQSLAHQINSLIKISKIIDLQSLRITEYDQPLPHIPNNVKGYWTLFIDVLCISLDGNVLDAAWLAIMAALKTMRLPKALWNADEGKIFCVHGESHPFKMRRNIPYMSSFVIIPVVDNQEVQVQSRAVETKTKEDDHLSFVLNDPDAFEEDEAKETLTILVSVPERHGENSNVQEVSNGNLGCRIEKLEKSGGGNLGDMRLKECIASAICKAVDYDRKVREECQKLPV